MAQYKADDQIVDARLGEVKVLEAFDATENSPEQYIVLTAGGETVRTVLSTGEAVATPEPEPVAAETPASEPEATPVEAATDGSNI